MDCGWQVRTEQGGYNYVTFDSDKTVCFVVTDNQAVIWGRGLNNSALQCHVVRFRGPPVFTQRTALGTSGRDSPFLDIDARKMGNGTVTLLAYVGREVNFTIRARDPNPEDVVTILIVEDPGIPIGATVGPNTCVNRGVVPDKMAYPIGGAEVASTCAEAFREFRWIPKEGEDGATYRVCFVARDAAGFCAGPYDHVVSDYGPRSTSGGYYSRPHCVDIQVESADTTWHPETVATARGSNKVEHVGCLVEYAIKAGGSGKYNTLVSFAPSVPPPPGMRLLTLSGGSTHSGDLLLLDVLLCRRCLTRAARHRSLSSTCLRLHVDASVSPSLSLTLSCRPVLLLPSHPPSPSLPLCPTALLQWTPTRGMEGSAFSVCVDAAPQGWGGGVWGAPPPYGNPRLTNGEPRLPTRCIHIKVWKSLAPNPYRTR